jgi:hypothetical protein
VRWEAAVFGAGAGIDAGCDFVTASAVGAQGVDEAVDIGDEAVAAARIPPIRAPTTRPVVAPSIQFRIALSSDMTHLQVGFPEADTTVAEESRVADHPLSSAEHGTTLTESHR